MFALRAFVGIIISKKRGKCKYTFAPKTCPILPMEISKAQKSDIPEILALQKAAFLPIAAVREGAIPPVFFAVGLGRKSAVADIYF